MIYRCKDLGIFDERQVTNLYKEISRKRWRTSEPLDGPDGLAFEQPLLLRKITELVIDSGKLSPDEVKAAIRLSPEWIGALAGIPPSLLTMDEKTLVEPTLK
jgi:Zn-dependent peptidase ImmA (M78 family)